MSDMYGKLGEYLNNVLETGEVPQEEILKDQDPCINENSRENPGPFDFNDHYKTQNSNNFTSFEEKSKLNKKNTNENQSETRKNNETDDIKLFKFIKQFKNTEKKDKTGEILRENQVNYVKMYKYTKIMHITPDIQWALGTLDIAYPFTLTELKKKYHFLLKKTHPDTNNGKTDEITGKNQFQNTVQDIKKAYSILRNTL